MVLLLNVLLIHLLLLIFLLLLSNELGCRSDLCLQLLGKILIIIILEFESLKLPLLVFNVLIQTVGTFLFKLFRSDKFCNEFIHLLPLSVDDLLLLILGLALYTLDLTISL